AELIERGLVVARGTELVQAKRDDITPVPVLLDYLRDNLAHGGDHACVIASSGETYCWGRNGIGQLGNGTTTGSSRPVKVNGGLHFVSIAAGWDHTCALTEDGQAYCWGSNYMGKLGRGVPLPTPYPDPEPVTGGIRFVQISAGATHTCGLTADGELYCWGDNRYGALAATVTQIFVPE